MAFPDSSRKAPNVFVETYDNTGSPVASSTVTVTSSIIIDVAPAPPIALPVVDFIGDPLAGSEPLSVAFTDLSTNSPTIWEWDFENNGSVDSTLQNPTHIYPYPGIYSVRLVVYNASGSASLVKIGYIDVTPPPPQPITYPPFLMDNGPGFNGELIVMPFRMGIGWEFENSDITVMPFLMDNGPGFENPNITLIPAIMTNAVAFTNPNITLMPFLMDNGPGFENPNITLMPFVMDNSPGFENPNITLMPFVMDNSPGFENIAISVMPFVMDNSPGFENPNITTMPFTMGNPNSNTFYAYGITPVPLGINVYAGTLFDNVVTPVPLGIDVYAGTLFDDVVTPVPLIISGA